MPNRESNLSVITSADGATSTVDIAGNVKQHIFNLALLTRDICKATGIPPVVMANILPRMIHEYERTGMAGETIFDIGAIKKGGGTP